MACQGLFENFGFFNGQLNHHKFTLLSNAFYNLYALINSTGLRFCPQGAGRIGEEKSGAGPRFLKNPL
jgi:hypothetical protein